MIYLARRGIHSILKEFLDPKFFLSLGFTWSMGLSRREFLISGSLTLAAASIPHPVHAAGVKTLSNGVDISWLPDVEAAGGLFYTSSGQRIDPISLLKMNGVRIGRIRVFVNPQTLNGDLSRALTLAKRLKSQRMEICLDLHYSDNWADPKNQATPKEWSTEIASLEREVTSYTEKTLQQFVNVDAAPKWVQIGNEIGGGFLWPLGQIANGSVASWQNFIRLHNAGTRALRRIIPSARSVVHLEWGGDPDRVRWWLLNAQKFGLANCDVIGLSYYSQWSGSLTNLENTLNVVSSEFKFPVVIAETAYPWISQQFGNDVVDIATAKLSGIPYSPQGQKQFVQSLRGMLLQQPANRGLGFWWWEGLATIVRSPDEAILLNGGMANATLVDTTGKALPALKLMHA